jgi:heterodisulfide reductase subunit C
MVVKRLGPSLVPAEAVIPLARLSDFMEEVEKKINHPVIKEGTVIRKGKDGKPEIVILGFIPADQRQFSYNLVFSLSLSIMNIAERNGGRAYATGLYFKNKAGQILGPERVARIKAFKKQIDGKEILNPGKVIGYGLLDMAMDVGGVLEPLTRPLGNYIITRIGERLDYPLRDIPPDVAWYAYSCSQCGYCVEECDQFYGRGWESQSPRGKWYWLREYLEGRAEWTQEQVNTFLVCTTCELCNLRCSAALPIEPSWMKLRGKLIEEQKRMTFPPFEMMAEALRSQGNIWAGYRKNRSDWFPEDLKEKHGPGRKAKVVYFAGCTASYVEHDIAIASVRLLDKAGVDFTYAGNPENCCGTPMLVAGKWELFGENMRRNIEVIKSCGADTVVSSCPACDMMWRQVYPVWAKKQGIEYNIKSRHY